MADPIDVTKLVSGVAADLLTPPHVKAFRRQCAPLIEALTQVVGLMAVTSGEERCWRIEEKISKEAVTIEFPAVWGYPEFGLTPLDGTRVVFTFANKTERMPAYSLNVTGLVPHNVGHDRGNEIPGKQVGKTDIVYTVAIGASVPDEFLKTVLPHLMKLIHEQGLFNSKKLTAAAAKAPGRPGDASGAVTHPHPGRT